MSHTPTVFSPAGTPFIDRTVGELVAERPDRSRVFQKYSIGFCCQGSRTLREACELKGLDPDAMANELEALGAESPSLGNPAELPLEDLCRHIVETHHGFLRSELPRLHAMSQRVAQVHGGHTPSLVEIYHTFTAMAEGLVGHVERAEDEFYAAVGEKAPGSLEEPIVRMRKEHAETGSAMERLRELTNGFQPPVDACNTYRALFGGLQDLDQDLQRHIHLENFVLFPTLQDGAGDPSRN